MKNKTTKKRTRKRSRKSAKKQWLSYLVLAVLALGVYLYEQYQQRQEEEITVEPAKVASLKTMAQLCVVDIYSEVPILDTINSKVIFAVQKQQGSISFDLEGLDPDLSGDTIRLTLPPEIVELRESTEPNAWEVIDTKSVGPMSILRSDKFTVEEENAAKAHAGRKAIRQLYRNGTVRKARADARKNLAEMLQLTYRKPVIVSDPTPNGVYKGN